MMAQGGVSLPAGYTKLEYLESNGEHYIDTGFKPKWNSRVVVDIEGLGITTQMIFGTRDTNSSTSSNQFLLFRSSATTIRSDYFKTNKSIDISDTSARTIIDKNANVVTLFGTTITNTPVSAGECKYNLYLFAFNNAGNVGYSASFKLYSCQIYDNGILVRDYVPCINPDGARGLYDVVNGVFYNLLPRYYTRLDFIESDGTQYIDTNYKPNSNTKVIFKGYNNNANSKWLFGAWNAANSSQYGISMQNGAGVRYGSQKATITNQNVGDVYGELNKAAYNFNGTTGTLSAETFSCSYNLFIGALNQAGTPTDSSYGFIGRIYSVKIWDNGALVRDFIPAMNASGEAGLYDLKNDVWYGFTANVTKITNKISIWSSFNDSLQTTGFQSQYPLASKVTINHTICAYQDLEFNPAFSYESRYVMAKDMQRSPEIGHLFHTTLSSGVTAYEGDVISSITSITPTEDDTYIYTF